jgi:hypothetical protein
MKFRVYGLYTATKYLGEFEAHDKESAIALASEGENLHASLCHQCTDELELDDNYPHNFIAEED